MPIPFGSNISYRGPLQNFVRDSFKTLEEMKNYNEDYLPPIFTSTCEETGKLYIFNANNTVDETLGKWREVSGGSSEQSDWEETSEISGAFIKNKPDIQKEIKDNAKLATFAVTVTEEGEEEVTIEQAIQKNIDAIDVLNGTEEGSVAKAVADGIAASYHLKKEVVIELPAIEDAKEDVLYLLKVEDGFDTYMLLEDEEGNKELRKTGTTKSSGEAVFPESFVTNTTVGGVESGTSIYEGDSIATIVKNMLLKYIKPVLSFVITPATTLYYFGQKVASEVLKVTVTKNSGKITKVIFKRDGVELDTVENEEGITTESYTDSTEISDTTTYTVEGSGSDDVSAEIKITFCNPTFAGTVGADVTEVTADDITGLEKKFANNKKGYTYSGITMDYGKILYAYPKSFGALTSISDGVNPYTDSYTRSEVTVDINGTDVVYYAYLLTDAAGVENFKQIYS